MTTVSKYRVFCTTEAKYFYIWDVVTPTKCINNSSHDINSSDIAVVEQVSNYEVIVREEAPPTNEIPTQGYFKAITKKIACPTGTTSVITLSWPYPISILSVKTNVASHQQGDRLVVKVVDGIVVGVLTASVASDAVILNVSSTVVSNIKKGFKCSITDGTTLNDLGEVVEITPTTITTSAATTTSFNVGTYVKMTVVVIDITFGNEGMCVVGESKIGSSYIKKNQVLTGEYTNNSNTSKDVYMLVEYLY